MQEAVKVIQTKSGENEDWQIPRSENLRLLASDSSISDSSIVVCVADPPENFDFDFLPEAPQFTTPRNVAKTWILETGELEAAGASTLIVSLAGPSHGTSGQRLMTALTLDIYFVSVIGRVCKIECHTDTEANKT